MKRTSHLEGGTSAKPQATSLKPEALSHEPQASSLNPEERQASSAVCGPNRQAPSTAFRDDRSEARGSRSLDRVVREKVFGPRDRRPRNVRLGYNSVSDVSDAIVFGEH